MQAVGPEPCDQQSRPFRDPIEWESSLRDAAGQPIRPSSPAWRAVIKAFYGTALDDEEHELFLRLSGGREPPEGGFVELLVVAGRRAGKSETISRIALFEALYGGHQRSLAPGQLGLIPVISARTYQSLEVLNYVRGLARLPAIRDRLVRFPRNSVQLDTNIAVRVMAADAIAVSGGTAVMLIRDEWAKWPGDEAQMSDQDIEDSLRPALAPVEGAPTRRLVGITSAFIESGLAWRTERDEFGITDAPTVVVRGSTALFNPNIDRAFLAREKRKKPRIYLREYGDEKQGPVWQPTITESWFGSAVIDRAIEQGVVERPARPDLHYTIAIDQAFASDRFAAQVCHLEERHGRRPVAVQDCVRAWAAESKDEPLSSHEMAREVKALCERFDQWTVFCDQYAYVPLRDIFALYGIALVERPWAATDTKDTPSKATKFKRVRDGMRDGDVVLVANDEQTKEFQRIRGKLQQSGGETIAAGKGKDDMVSAAILGLFEAMTDLGPHPVEVGW